MAAPLILLCSHAAEQEWLTRIQTGMVPHTREGLVRLWSPDDIEPGKNRHRELAAACKAAEAAVLLVSPHLLAESLEPSQPAATLLQSLTARDRPVYVVHVRSSSIGVTILRNYPTLGDPSRPLEELDSAAVNRVLLALCTEIARIPNPRVSERRWRLAGFVAPIVAIPLFVLATLDRHAAPEPEPLISIAPGDLRPRIHVQLDPQSLEPLLSLLGTYGESYPAILADPGTHVRVANDLAAVFTRTLPLFRFDSDPRESAPYDGELRLYTRPVFAGHEELGVELVADITVGDQLATTHPLQLDTITDIAAEHQYECQAALECRLAEDLAELMDRGNRDFFRLFRLVPFRTDARLEPGGQIVTGLHHHHLRWLDRPTIGPDNAVFAVTDANGELLFRVCDPELVAGPLSSDETTRCSRLASEPDSNRSSAALTTPQTAIFLRAWNPL